MNEVTPSIHFSVLWLSYNKFYVQLGTYGPVIILQVTAHKTPN